MNFPDPNKANVLWNKGQNFFSAFFAEIAEVRKQIDNDTAFAHWCFDVLHIPLTAITRVSEVLTQVDAVRVKAELASAKAAEQEQKRKEREEREAMQAAERRRKEEERATVVAEKARKEELEKQQREAAERAAKKKASKRKNNKGWKEKQREELKTALAAVTSTNVVPIRNTKMSEKTDGDLVKQIKAAILRRDTSREEWIESSVELAGLLCEARARYPAHQRFSNWLEEHEINLNPDDRAALLKLGQNLDAMRVILERTESTSYRMIWHDTQKQIGAALSQ